MSTITTERLELRPWDETMAGDLVQLAGDERVMRYIGLGGVWTKQYALDRHRSVLEHWRTHGYGWRGIYEQDRFVGLGALNRLGPIVAGIDADTTEIGWWVDPVAWGRGIATEAALALRDEGFGRIGARQLVARFRPENSASERVMIKLGMRLWGDVTGRQGEDVRVYLLDNPAGAVEVRER